MRSGTFSANDAAVELPSSHVVFLSHPREVVAMIEKAAEATKYAYPDTPTGDIEHTVTEFDRSANGSLIVTANGCSA